MTAVPAIARARQQLRELLRRVDEVFADQDEWRLYVVRRRFLAWVRATQRRRRIVRFSVMMAVVHLIALLMGPVATANSGTADPGSAGGVALTWTGVRDSAGVGLWDYMFVTSEGSVFSPMQSMVAMVLVLEFNVWWVLITVAIWIVGYGLSFGWLDIFSQALHGVADALTGQIATTAVMVTAATLGAFIVAYFVLRGQHAKATRQVVTMLGVAIFGTVFLAEPLADVLSSDGLLAQGRDVGISIAAGLNGNSNPDPDTVVSGMQSMLADNLMRKPLQMWNFGHVIDDRSSCGSAWSAGATARDSELLKSGLRNCGDLEAYAAVENPGFGQIGTGLILLVCGGILILFAVGLSLKVIRASMDCIYHGFMAIFGFAAGGFVYGPTQTFLIRNLVDSVIAALSMAAYAVFLGVYVLFLGNLFEQADGQVFAVLVIGAVVEAIAVTQLRRLSAGLDRGGEWVANRFALAAQGAPASGGTALGVGPGTTVHALSQIHLMSMMGALNTLNANPLVGLALGRRNPFDPWAGDRQLAEKQNFELAQWRSLHRESTLDLARASAEKAGGMHTAAGVAAAIDALRSRNMLDEQLLPSLGLLGADADYIEPILMADKTVGSFVPKNELLFAPLQKAAVAWYQAMNRPVDKVGQKEHEAWVAYAMQTIDGVHSSAFRPDPTLTEEEFHNRIDWDFIRDVQTDNKWNSRSRLRKAVPAERWRSVSRETRLYLGQTVLAGASGAVHDYYDNMSVENAVQASKWVKRMLNLDFPRVKDGPDAFTITP